MRRRKTDRPPHVRWTWVQCAILPVLRTQYGLSHSQIGRMLGHPAGGVRKKCGELRIPSPPRPVSDRWRREIGPMDRPLADRQLSRLVAEGRRMAATTPLFRPPIQEFL